MTFGYFRACRQACARRVLQDVQGRHLRRL